MKARAPRHSRGESCSVSASSTARRAFSSSSICPPTCAVPCRSAVHGLVPQLSTHPFPLSPRSCFACTRPLLQALYETRAGRRTGHIGAVKKWLAYATITSAQRMNSLKSAKDIFPYIKVAHPLCSTALKRPNSSSLAVESAHPICSMGACSHMQDFNVDITDIERPLHTYGSFNEFFARRLRPGARPIASPDSPAVVVSPADCRIHVFASAAEATRFWIKGQHE